MTIKVLAVACMLFSFSAKGQTPSGSLPSSKEEMPSNTAEEYAWWNLLHYAIAVTPDYQGKSISGTNLITFVAIQDGQTLRIDLQEPMILTQATWKQQPLSIVKKEKNIYIIQCPREIKAGEQHSIVLHFRGQPVEALKPPYDSGWIWAKDEKGRPWMSVACQGSGASIWLPCKDIPYDEPDLGATISITIPDTLTAIANGRLKSKVIGKKKKATYTWEVVNPINHYNIIPYIGKYVHWQERYAGLKGPLDCDFWALDYNLSKGRQHLQQTDTMLSAFEYWLGPYPFYEDGYKLVEAPMPGMEHQSAIAYGNGFQNGFKGKDFISGTKWGLLWDFMMVHESGHEWFGNNISCNSHGDTWIHEGFTKYLETLYTDFSFGKQAGNEYSIGTWKRIKNDKPILGTSTSDKYYKGAAMLHMIRQILGDTVFRGWLQELQTRFKHQTVSTQPILAFLNEYTHKDFTTTFRQYLQTTQIPVLEYEIQHGNLQYRWKDCVEGFAMPIKISLDSKTSQMIYPTTAWQQLITDAANPAKFTVDSNFLVQVREKAGR